VLINQFLNLSRTISPRPARPLYYCIHKRLTALNQGGGFQSAPGHPCPLLYYYCRVLVCSGKATGMAPFSLYFRILKRILYLGNSVWEEAFPGTKVRRLDLTSRRSSRQEEHPSLALPQALCVKVRVGCEACKMLCQSSMGQMVSLVHFCDFLHPVLHNDIILDFTDGCIWFVKTALMA
jgi:hypothetical protein